MAHLLLNTIGPLRYDPTHGVHDVYQNFHWPYGPDMTGGGHGAHFGKQPLAAQKTHLPASFQATTTFFQP